MSKVIDGDNPYKIKILKSIHNNKPIVGNNAGGDNPYKIKILKSIHNFPKILH